MGNSLRCCLACVLPCGALDLIRIVHLNGNVDELTGPVTVREVLKANPNHVLSKPSSQGMARRILLLSPETELKKGSIYFLIPESSLPEKKKIKNVAGKPYSEKRTSVNTHHHRGPTVAVAGDDSDRAQLKEVRKSERKSSSSASRRDRRRGRVAAVWKPHLDSICED